MGLIVHISLVLQYVHDNAFISLSLASYAPTEVLCLPGNPNWGLFKNNFHLNIHPTERSLCWEVCKQKSLPKNISLYVKGETQFVKEKLKTPYFLIEGSFIWGILRQKFRRTWNNLENYCMERIHVELNTEESK